MNRTDTPCTLHFSSEQADFCLSCPQFTRPKLAMESVGLVGEENVFSISSLSLCLCLMVNNRTLLGYLHCCNLSQWSCRTPMTAGGKILVAEPGRMVSEVLLARRAAKYPSIQQLSALQFKLEGVVQMLRCSQCEKWMWLPSSPTQGQGWRRRWAFSLAPWFTTMVAL